MCAYSVYIYMHIFASCPKYIKKTLATATKTMMYMLETYGIYIYIYILYIYVYTYNVRPPSYKLVYSPIKH